MKNLKKKKFKGMTLVEIIISLAVVSALTLILVGASNLINNYLKSSTQINKRVSHQAPIAEAANVAAAAEKADGKVDIILTPSGCGEIHLSGDMYKMDTGGRTTPGKEFGRGLNMRFIDGIDTTVIPPTSESGT